MRERDPASRPRRSSGQCVRYRIVRCEMLQKTLSDLNACSKGDFVAALANVFEYSPWIAEQAALARPFAGMKRLFDAMKAAVDCAPSERRLALITAHPDLAARAQRAACASRLRVRGRLSSHVRDAHSGRPAAARAAELVELCRRGASPVVTRT